MLEKGLPERPRPQVRAPDVTNEERVTGEDEPGLFRPAPPVGDHIGIVGWGVAGCRQSANNCVPELDDVAISERDEVEVDFRTSREVGSRASLDERRQAGNMVGLHVGFEDGTDQRAETPRACPA